MLYSNNISIAIAFNQYRKNVQNETEKHMYVQNFF